MARVTVIPASINPATKLPTIGVRKLRTCGYARVSTDKDEQFTSYEAQVDYYTKYIKANPEWEFVRVYTDEGISGTSTKRREGFNEMITDALAGKIDLIVTKSVSRFARNTVDSLTTIRRLKEKGVQVFFEKENIWTLDSKGELLLTIMSSLAQEESHNKSEIMNIIGDVKGKNCIIVDDMISSGDSVIDVAKQLKDKGAKRIFVFATFGLFCNGLENMDKAYEEGIFTKIFTTNLVYRTPELLEREWYGEVNMCKYVAYIIDTLNHDETISELLNPVKRIHALMDRHKAELEARGNN